MKAACWRAAVLGFCALSAADIWVGFAHPPGEQSREVVTLVRIGLTGALALTMLLGPGIAISSLRRRPTSTAFLMIPGFAASVGVGLAAWLGHPLGGERVAAVSAGLVIGFVALVAATRPVGSQIDRHDTSALVIVIVVMIVALGKSFYSVGTEGELYAPLISRILEVGDRGDARISFHVVQLVTNGISPFTDEGQANFLPFTFSDRGPLPGMASAPAVLLAGGKPTVEPPNQPWHPFDPEGFEAYRIMMIALASTAFLAVHGLMRELRGPRAARFALALAATTPFLVHEVYFTWPKLVAAGFVVVAGHLVLLRRPLRAGFAAGVGYLCHPVALLSVPVLVLLGLCSAWQARGRRDRVVSEVTTLARLATGPLATLAFWRVINGSRYTQSGFLNYLKGVSIYNPVPVTVSSWVAERVASALNTLVPLYLVIAYSDNRGINSYYAPSPPIVHFYFQYWNTVPFGMGIVFVAFAVLAVARAARHHPWAIGALVVLPLVGFIVYYGAAETGLMREGLHAWVLTVIMVCAWVRFTLPVRRWEQLWVMGVVLAARSIEVLLVLILPPWVTMHQVTTQGLHVTDAAALTMMFGGIAVLGCEVVLANRLPADAGEAAASVRDAAPA